MRVPNSWNDISIEQYSDLLKLSEIENEEERRIEQLCVLLDTDPDVIKKMPAYQVKEINESLKFISVPPKAHFNRRIEIDGVKFGFITDLELLTLGEWIDLDNYCDDFENSRHKLAALLWRPIVWEDKYSYKIEDYDSTKVKQWAPVFNKKLSIQELHGASVFFSLIVTELLRSSKEFLIPQEMKMKI